MDALHAIIQLFSIILIFFLFAYTYEYFFIKIDIVRKFKDWNKRRKLKSYYNKNKFAQMY